MSLYAILIITWLHFIADFIWQSDKMALNKSVSNRWLFAHTGIYTLIFTIPFLFYNPFYGIINGVLHTIVDYITSRLCRYYHNNGDRHMFFVIIGLDQSIHFTCLFITAYFMLGI